MILKYPEQIDEVIRSGKYKADWESLSNHKTPGWYIEGKLGIFIHWGIYSVPAHSNEWYSRHMYLPGHEEYEYHRKTYGEQKDFGYKDFIPSFTGEKFSADEWVSLFRKAGARFVMPVAEHHDGFAMYDTAFNRWNAKNMGPCRNVLGEIKAACEREGLQFCASTHRAEHYFFMNSGREYESDVNDPAYADFYGPAVSHPELNGDAIFTTTNDTFTASADEEWMEDWLVRCCELIDRYQPKILYFDWWIHNKGFKPYLKKLAAYYYNRAEEWGEEVTINYKHEAFPPTVATYDVERGALTDISPSPWQTDTAIGKNSWGYCKENEYKNSRQIICDLTDIVSKNGMLLLNIGPRPDGTITKEETKVLLDLGKWLEVNGEGIYGTTCWKQFGEGNVNNEAGSFTDGDEKQFTENDFRFTYKNGSVYAFQMRPGGKNIRIHALRKKGAHDFLIENVALLGKGMIASAERTEEALQITLAEEPQGDLPICFKIEIS